VGFNSLYAFDFCGDVGSVYTSITLAFEPGELSSYGPPVAFMTTTYTGETTAETLYEPGPPTAINYADLSQNCSTIEGYSFVPGNPSQFEFLSKFAFPI
jgi:hypothetical protein